MLRIKTTYSDLYFLLISVFAFTFLRKYLVIVLPILFVLSFLVFNQKITRNIIILLLIALLNFILSTLFYGFFIINNLVSLSLIFFPFIFLLGRSNPKNNSSEFLHRFMIISSTVLIIVDASAFIQLIGVVIKTGMVPNDSFKGIYGNSGLAMHTLCLINFLYALYFYFVKYRTRAIIFAFAGILSFFHMGLLLFLTSIAAFVIYRKTIFKYLLSFVILVFVFNLLLKTIHPASHHYLKYSVTQAWLSLKNLDYERDMNDALMHKHSITPRKFTFHIGAFKRILSDPLIILSGTGPGTYNSRTSFLLNGDYSRIAILKSSIKFEPPFASEDVYPLWNSKIVYQYNDGTKNEPFSSIVALFIEYGFIFSVLFFILFFNKVKIIARLSDSRISNFTYLSFIFFLLCIASDNYFEYPELSWIYLTILKCIEFDGITAKIN